MLANILKGLNKYRSNQVKKAFFKAKKNKYIYIYIYPPPHAPHHHHMVGKEGWPMRGLKQIM